MVANVQLFALFIHRDDMCGEESSVSVDKLTVTIM